MMAPPRDDLTPSPYPSKASADMSGHGSDKVGHSAADTGSFAATAEHHGVGADLFRRLVSSVRDYAIFALDATGHIMTWNEGAQRIKGYARMK